MIAVLRAGTTDEKLNELTAWLEGQGLGVHVSRGKFQTIVGLVGDTSKVDDELLGSLEMVESVKRISEPFKSANRKFHPDDTVIEVGGVRIGGGEFAVMAGPCSVESAEQVGQIASAVKLSGANVLRGGAFKPRTSPYDFQGLHAEGIRFLRDAGDKNGMPIVTEIMNPAHLPMFENVDIIQVGARNMQNFELLRELGKTNKPILLKRGLCATIKEFLMSAEYIMAGGNDRVILCERGVRGFDSQYTRNVLDLSAVPVLHELSHLPVVVDPSHATGVARYVKSMALAAVACGADGLMIEVHNDPAHALCDGAQSLTPEAFDDVMKSVAALRGTL